MKTVVNRTINAKTQLSTPGRHIRKRKKNPLASDNGEKESPETARITRKKGTPLEKDRKLSKMKG